MFKRLTRRDGLLLLTHFAIETSYPKEEIILMGKFAQLMTGEINDISSSGDVVELVLDSRFIKEHLRKSVSNEHNQITLSVDGVSIRVAILDNPNYVLGFNQYKISV